MEVHECVLTRLVSTIFEKDFNEIVDDHDFWLELLLYFVFMIFKYGSLFSILETHKEDIINDFDFHWQNRINGHVCLAKYLSLGPTSSAI